MGVKEMETTRTEELTLSIARGATGKAGDGQILALLVGGVLAGINLRAQVDLGLVLSTACLVGVLSVLERRQFYAIVQRLQRTRDGGAGRLADGDIA
jgi:hypothetical protein